MGSGLWAAFVNARVPSVATRPVAALTTGALYLVGGLTVTAAVLIAQPRTHQAWLVGVPVVAVLWGAALLRAGGRTPWWLFHASVIGGSALATTLIVLGRHLPIAAATLPMYVFAILGSAFFFSLVGLAFHLAHILAVTTLVLPFVGVPWESVVTLDGLCLSVAVVVAFLSRAADAIEVDALTGLLNRRGIERRLAEAVRRDGEGELSLILLELDGFKEIAESEGNHYADQVLRECAARLTKMVPRGVEIGRYDGDDYALVALIAPGWAAEEGAMLADSLRPVFPLTLTVSAGVAARMDGDTASLLLERADVALYAARADGRGQTEVYGRRDPSDLPPRPEGPPRRARLRSI